MCHQICIEVTIPPAKAVAQKSERLIPISELDDLIKGSFPVRIRFFSLF